MPAELRGWRGQLAYIDAAHRVHARVEDCHPHRERQRDRPVPLARLRDQLRLAGRRLIAAALLSWLRLLALDGDLARAEPKTLRYRILHAAARLVRGGRRRQLKIPATWPWAHATATAWARITALPQAP